MAHRLTVATMITATPRTTETVVETTAIAVKITVMITTLMVIMVLVLVVHSEMGPISTDAQLSQVKAKYLMMIISVLSMVNTVILDSQFAGYICNFK